MHYMKINAEYQLVPFHPYYIRNCTIYRHFRVYFKRGVQPKCAVQNEKCGVHEWKMCSPK